MLSLRWSSAGGGRWLSLEGFCICACLCFQHHHRVGCIGRCLADALPPCSGGRLATVVVLVIVSGRCFAAMVGWVDALPPLLCCRSLHPWRCNILSQVLVAFVSMIAGLPVFLVFSCICFRFNSLCLLRFVLIVLLSS